MSKIMAPAVASGTREEIEDRSSAKGIAFPGNLAVQKQILLAWGLLILVTLLYALAMSFEAVLRYETFKATAFDLGNMDQVIWNTIHGRLFQFTNQAIDYYGPPTRLAIHFEPIILPLSLLYAFGSDPRILLVFQTLALASGTLPVFLLARYYLPRWPMLAPVMVVAYLLSPALLGLNIFDFHPVSMATPLLLYALLALTYKRYWLLLLACVLAAATKEDVPLAVAMLGVMLIWKYRLPRLGTILLVGGLLWSFVAFEVIIPHFYPGAQSNNFWYRYEQFGDTPGQAILNLVIHPWLPFTTFISIDRIYYLASLFRSAGFLSLLAPEWLIPALPSMAVNLLSTDPSTYSGVYHYNATIIPFVMLAAIHGTRRLINIWKRWRGEPVEGIDWPPEGKANADGERQGSFASLRMTLPTRVFKLQNRPLQFMRRRMTRLVVVPCMRIWKWLARVGTVQWQRFSERMQPLARMHPLPRLQWMIFTWVTVMTILNFLIAAPMLNIFWADHLPGPREQHIEQLLAMIPPNASVSASDNLNPHVSEREHLAVFPSLSDDAPNNSGDLVQYIIVDLDDVFPQNRATVTNELDHLQRSGQYVVIARAEGVILLERRT